MDTASPEYVQNRKAARTALQRSTRVEQIKAFWNVSATRQPNGTITLMAGRLDTATNRMTFVGLGEMEYPPLGNAGMISGIVEAAYRAVEAYQEQQPLPF